MNSASLLWTGEGFVPNATLPVTDRGVRYGMSLFETVRVRNHRAERVVTHLHSLRAACALAGFPDPATALSEAWGQLASEVLPALIPPAMAGGESGTARIYVTAGDGGPGAPAIEPRLFLLFEPRPLPAPGRPPFAVTAPRIAPPGYPRGLKSGAYWANADSYARARAAGRDEALLANPDGTLRSACMANVFVRIDRRWLTPSADSGARAGTVRAWVLDQGFAGERTIDGAELASADAAFLTNSWIGIEPIGQIGERPIMASEEVIELAAAFDLVDE